MHPKASSIIKLKHGVLPMLKCGLYPMMDSISSESMRYCSDILKAIIAECVVHKWKRITPFSAIIT